MKKNLLGKKHFILLIGVLALSAVGGAGCNDMTTQQYQDKQAEANQERLNAYKGTYVGAQTQLDGKTPYGGVQITIDTTAQPESSQDGTTMVSQAKVIGHMTVVGAISVEASFSSATIDPDNGTFYGTITQTNSSDSANPNTMTVEGTISGGNFTNGRITSTQFPGSGGLFTASTHGALPSQQSLAKSGPSDSPAESINYFSGVLNGKTCTGIQNGEYVDNGPCEVSMTIADAPTSSSDSFFDFYLTNNNVIVNVTISGVRDSSPASAKVPLPASPQTFGGTSSNQVTFDSVNGRLQGTGSAVDASGAQVSLKCDERPVTGNANGKFGFHCSILSNYGMGGSQFDVTPALAPALSN